MEFRREITKWKDFEGIFYLDIEDWPLCDVPDSVASRNITRFSRAIVLVREIAPKVVFGIYSMPPTFGYWAVLSKDTTRLRNWQMCNDRLVEIGRKVDIIFPSLYTSYTDEAGWDTYANAVLSAARAYGKPVLPFLWPEYDDSNRALAGVLLPARVWRHELDFVRKNADGVVLWNAWRRPWHEDAEWWRQTRLFLRSLPGGTVTDSLVVHSP